MSLFDTGTSRRAFLRSAAAASASMSLGQVGLEAQTPSPSRDYAAAERPANSSVEARMRAQGKLRITRLETMLVAPRWLFLKVHTDEGITGWGEPIVEGRAETCVTAIVPQQGSFRRRFLRCRSQKR